jgi:hypothetical protein
MKRLLLAVGLVIAVTTAGFADDLCCYWVVGNRASNSCDIVGSNPVIAGDIWFGDGPYKSLEDAKLARSTVRACPKEDSSGK